MSRCNCDEGVFRIQLTIILIILIVLMQTNAVKLFRNIGQIKKLRESTGNRQNILFT